MNKKSSYSRDDLIDCANGNLFGPGNAQLPLPPMLMLDRIVSISETGGNADKGIVIAELDINPDLWFFKCHFPGDPVMPGCLGLDAMWQILGFFLAWSGGLGHGRALGSGSTKFTGQVTQSCKLVSYQIDIKRLIKRKLTMGIADATMSVDSQPIYTANNLRVGLFAATNDF